MAAPAVVLYHAEWPLLGDGICRQARRQVVTLARAGVRVGLKTIGYPEVDAHESARREVEGVRLTGKPRIPLAIRQTVIHSPQYLANLVREHGVAPRDSIVATWWERDRVDRAIIEVLKGCAELWVTCRRNRDAFVTSGMPREKVHVIPFPLPPARAVCETCPSGRRFYNIGKWEPRKNQHGLIGAFLEAFMPSDDATLVIKTRAFGNGKWPGYPDIAESIQHWKRNAAVRARGWDDGAFAAKVHVLTSELSDAQIAALHDENNIYVSASHGEALDIPALEAKRAGNRLVHVGFGGSEDYAEPDDVHVPWRLGAVHPGYGWEAGAQWGIYEAAALRDALRGATARADRTPATTLREYDEALVGQKMRERILALAAARDRTGAHLGVANL